VVGSARIEVAKMLQKIARKADFMMWLRERTKV
jgi:hypothetical protein